MTEWTMTRREWMRASLLSVIWGTWARGAGTPPEAPTAQRELAALSWAGLKGQFRLDPQWSHLSGLLLASHPQVVREEIERLQKEFDANPGDYWDDNIDWGEDRVRHAAAEYIDAPISQIALTDSTTMGIAMFFGGLYIRSNHEVLTTEHEHYSTVTSLGYLTSRTGARVKKVSLYQDSALATKDEMVEALRRAITPATRVIAITWVHSGTGVKTPVAEIAAMMWEANRNREAADKMVLFVDGVHGFGVEDATMPSLGCDFFVAGTHKWLFGPRGTGIFYGHSASCDRVNPVIPSFSIFTGNKSWGNRLTPGGFHSFDLRWALHAAFHLHLRMGKRAVADRIHSLNDTLKHGLSQLSHVRLRTPMAREVSSGITCFEVEGLTPAEVVKRLREKRILASTTPYAVPYARLTPGLLNDEKEVGEAVAAIATLR